jgi:hypothetical protein
VSDSKKDGPRKQKGRLSCSGPRITRALSKIIAYSINPYNSIFITNLKGDRYAGGSRFLPEFTFTEVEAGMTIDRMIG